MGGLGNDPSINNVISKFTAKKTMSKSPAPIKEEQNEFDTVDTALSSKGIENYKSRVDCS